MCSAHGFLEHQDLGQDFRLWTPIWSNGPDPHLVATCAMTSVEGRWIWQCVWKKKSADHDSGKLFGVRKAKRRAFQSLCITLRSPVSQYCEENLPTKFQWNPIDMNFEIKKSKKLIGSLLHSIENHAVQAALLNAFWSRPLLASLDPISASSCGEMSTGRSLVDSRWEWTSLVAFGRWSAHTGACFRRLFNNFYWKFFMNFLWSFSWRIERWEMPLLKREKERERELLGEPW